jgi:hypothetical protein
MDKLLHVRTILIEAQETLNNLSQKSDIEAVMAWLDMFRFSYPNEIIKCAVIGFAFQKFTRRDVTIFKGSYIEKCSTKVKIKTSGYLLDQILYQCDEKFNNYIDVDRYKIIPEDYLPKKIQNNNDFLKIFEESLLSNGKLPEMLIDYLAIKGLMLYREKEPYSIEINKIDFDNMDY